MPAESWVVTGPQIIEVEDVRAVRAALVAGRVDVVGRDEPGARIEVHRVDGRALEVELDDGELRVGYAFTLGGWENVVDRLRNIRAKDSADVHIAVHRDVAVKLATVTAEGLLAETVQGGSLATVSGALVTDSTHGALVANGVSGDFAVHDHTGDLRANTVSGAVTASGAFTQVSVSTVSGPTALDITRAAAVSVKTVSGDMTVRMPETMGATVSARTVSGRVIVDGQARGVTGSALGTVEVAVGDGTCRLDVASLSGDLTVLRSARVAGAPGAGA